jgi:hypothetical protein
MRRPAIRSLVGGAAGLVAGIIGGVTLTSLSAAGVGVPGSAAPGLEASHVPRALTLPGEPATLRYAIVCAPREDGRPCAGSGEVYMRAGQAGSYERIPLVRGDDSSEGRYFAEVPPALASSRTGFSYYAVLHDDASGASVTVPAGGAAAPDRSLPLGDATQVDLGRTSSALLADADTRVLHASWGSEPGAGGAGRLAGARIRRPGLVRRRRGRNRHAPRSGERACRAVGSRARRDGDARGERRPGRLRRRARRDDGRPRAAEPSDSRPLLRSFRGDGTARWTQRLADRTGQSSRSGPRADVLQQPSEQWLPAAEQGTALDRGAQAARGRPGRPLAHGREVVVDRVGSSELRIAELAGNAVVRSWRVTSETPLGEVQLAEPRGNELVVVLKTYTEVRAEYVVLALRQRGAAERFSVEPSEWAESAPLARFRLAGSSLYQLGSTAAVRSSTAST